MEATLSPALQTKNTLKTAQPFAAPQTVYASQNVQAPTQLLPSSRVQASARASLPALEALGKGLRLLFGNQAANAVKTNQAQQQALHYSPEQMGYVPNGTRLNIVV